ncbi:hypothetical protein E2C01_084069 [Portunus trituberculatus]|uniref:Uncharacterized protein n=1 Tax=Portunus trituberculatus TaxID=210409 RepID=A0A5B7J5B5_PORTR|nr:hypothetical protein [Portunus trituberculatus]
MWSAAARKQAGPASLVPPQYISCLFASLVPPQYISCLFAVWTLVVYREAADLQDLCFVAAALHAKAYTAPLAAQILHLPLYIPTTRLQTQQEGPQKMQ